MYTLTSAYLTTQAFARECVAGASTCEQPSFCERVLGAVGSLDDRSVGTTAARAAATCYCWATPAACRRPAAEDERLHERAHHVDLVRAELRRGGAGDIANGVGTIAMTPDSWSHVAAVFTGSAYLLFVNGQQSASVSSSSVAYSQLWGWFTSETPPAAGKAT